MRILASTAALTAATALAIGLAGPANAVTITTTDPQDTFHGSDLRAVKVKHSERNLVVTTSHTNLRRDPRSGSSAAVYIDTDSEDRGPEFVFVGGFFEGTDYQLLHTEGFGAKKWGAAADGSYIMRIDYETETVRMRMSRETLGSPDRVRVAVRGARTRTDGSSNGLVDWLGDRREFTPWVDRG